MSEDLATLNDVDIYIRDIKYMINNNAKLILSNREKNIIFCENNNIKTNDIKHILLNLKREDFCKILNNRSINSLEKLYLFAPSIKDKNGKCMQLYIKINKIIESNLIILVSFHEAKYFLKTKFNSRSDDFE